MWVGINALGGGRNAHQIKPANGALAGFGRVDWQMGCHGLGQLSTDSVERVQRRQRVLENRADFLATNAAHILIAQIINAPAIQENFTSRDTSGRFQQADDCSPGHGFSGA